MVEAVSGRRCGWSGVNEGKWMGGMVMVDGEWLERWLCGVDGLMRGDWRMASCACVGGRWVGGRVMKGRRCVTGVAVGGWRR